MKIVAVHERSVPLRSEIRNAYIDFSAMTVSVVAVVTDQVRGGRPIVGYGFNSNGRYAAGGLLRERFIPRLMAADPASLLDPSGRNVDPHRIWDVLMTGEKPGGHGERSVAVAVLDMALWDVVAKVEGKPLCGVIAERYRAAPPDPDVAVYAAGGYYAEGKDLEALRREMRAYLEQGYAAVKMKIGGAPLDEDLRRIEAVLEVVGVGSALAVDANGRFDEPTALRYADALAPYRLRWYEEPGDPLDFALNSEVARRYASPLATGENLFSMQDARNLVRYGGMRPDRDVLQFDPALAYGLVEYLRTVEMLEAHGWSRRRLVPHGGHLFALHIAAGLGLGGNESYPGVFRPFGGFADGIPIEAGRVRPPTRQGSATSSSPSSSRCSGSSDRRRVRTVEKRLRRPWQWSYHSARSGESRGGWMMGRTLAFLVASTLVVAACGGATQAPTPTTAATAAATAAAKTTPPTAAPTQDPTKAIADFYRGKTIRVIVGLEAGGGFDTTARVLARHIGKYIPGEPTVVVENMVGAGSRVAANYLYEAAPKDGTAFGVFNELQVLQQALGQADIKFDAKQFGWLGSVFSATIVCIARKDSGITKVQDIMGASGKQFIAGSTGPGSNTGDFPQTLRTALGANIKIVSGYNGTAGISRAVDSSEVMGGCWTWESMSVTQGKNLADGSMVPLVQQGDEKIKELGNTPTAVDLATSDINKKLILAITTPTSISKSFTAPPGVPAERLKALQDAFTKAWNDKDLIEEAKKAKIDVAPKKAEDTKKVVDQLLSFDKATIDALKEALAKK